MTNVKRLALLGRQSCSHVVMFNTEVAMRKHSSDVFFEKLRAAYRERHGEEIDA